MSTGCLLEITTGCSACGSSKLRSPSVVTTSDMYGSCRRSMLKELSQSGPPYILPQDQQKHDVNLFPQNLPWLVDCLTCWTLQKLKQLTTCSHTELYFILPTYPTLTRNLWYSRWYNNANATSQGVTKKDMSTDCLSEITTGCSAHDSWKLRPLAVVTNSVVFGSCKRSMLEYLSQSGPPYILPQDQSAHDVNFFLQSPPGLIGCLHPGQIKSLHL